MAEQRFFQGWSQEELASRLAALEALAPSVDDEARREMEAGKGRWHPERSEAVIAREPPGAPIPGGPFERARELIAQYRFSDPSIVRGHFDPAAPLLGRRMLLEIQALGLHHLCGVVVGKVRDEQTDAESTFGFRYDTLEGHIERGEEWFLLRKDHASGLVRFTIRSRWRHGEFPNAWSRIGFTVLAGRYRALWLRRAHARMRAMLGEGATGEHPSARHDGMGDASAYLLATSAAALSGARSMAGPLTAALATRAAPAEGLPRTLGGHVPLTAAMALGEALADKHPKMGARVALLPWAGRIGAGAVAGAALASQLERDPLAGALLGGAAAGLITKVSFEARKRLAERLKPTAAGLAEDAIVGALSLALVAAVRARAE